MTSKDSLYYVQISLLCNFEYTFHFEAELDHVICFGQWNVSKRNIAEIWKVLVLWALRAWLPCEELGSSAGQWEEHSPFPLMALATTQSAVRHVSMAIWNWSIPAELPTNHRCIGEPSQDHLKELPSKCEPKMVVLSHWILGWLAMIQAAVWTGFLGMGGLTTPHLQHLHHCLLLPPLPQFGFPISNNPHFLPA